LKGKVNSQQYPTHGRSGGTLIIFVKQSFVPSWLTLISIKKLCKAYGTVLDTYAEFWVILCDAMQTLEMTDQIRSVSEWLTAHPAHVTLKTKVINVVRNIQALQQSETIIFISTSFQLAFLNNVYIIFLLPNTTICSLISWHLHYQLIHCNLIQKQI